MGHNRIRCGDAVSGLVAGSDGGPAVAAKLAGAAALALSWFGRRLTIYVAESFVGSARVIAPGGVVSRLAAREPFVAPSHLTYRRGGSSRVASENGAVTAVDLSQHRLLQVGTVPPGRPSARLCRPGCKRFSDVADRMDLVVRAPISGPDGDAVVHCRRQHRARPPGAMAD